jgi:D-ribose pyranase
MCIRDRIKGFPTIPDVLDAILPLLDLTGLYLANEFSEKVDAKTVTSYKKHYENIPTILIPHEEFKIKVGQSLAIIHTGDAVPYSSVILKSG